MKLISKGLLAEVLGKSNITELEFTSVYANMDVGVWYVADVVVDCININDLTVLLKDWAFANNIQITSTRLPSGVWNVHYHSGKFEEYTGATEHEAVLALCEDVYSDR